MLDSFGHIFYNIIMRKLRVFGRYALVCCGAKKPNNNLIPKGDN